MAWDDARRQLVLVVAAMLFVGAKISHLALLPQGQPERDRRARGMVDAMDAEGLRALILEMIPWFDEALLARFANALVDRAARNGSGLGIAPDGCRDDGRAPRRKKRHA